MVRGVQVIRNIQLRLATNSDTEFARGIHHRALRAVVVSQFGSWDEVLQNGFFENSGFPDGFEIIEFEGQPVGYMSTVESVSEIEVRKPIH